LGNRATQAETVGATIINYTYGYDNLNRLTQVQNGTATQQENYSYDPLDNRSSKSVGATTPTITAYVYDAANQLKEIHSGTTTGTLLASLTYDADGNLKGRSDSGLALTYDPLNRLAQATVGTQTQSYVYDDQGRRIQKTVAGVATNMLYNGADIVAEYGSTWGLQLAQYTQGPKIDDPIIRATATAAQYYHQDGLGSVVGVSNNLGGTDATQRFDAWGNKIASTGTAPHYGYTGREPDETGLIYYRARYLDPTLGRFTQRDPIGLRGGLNRYGYVGGNPVNALDPSGECPWCVAALVGAVVGGGMDLGLQLIQNGFDLNSVNLTSVGVSALAGAALSGLGPTGFLFGRGGERAAQFGYDEAPGLLNSGDIRFGWSGPVEGSDVLSLRIGGEHYDVPLIKVPSGANPVRDGAVSGAIGGSAVHGGGGTVGNILAR
jgi:RHS repeat-associated protein